MSIKELDKCHIIGLHNDLEKKHVVHYNHTEGLHGVERSTSGPIQLQCRTANSIVI